MFYFLIVNYLFPVFWGRYAQLELDATAHRSVLGMDIPETDRDTMLGASIRQESWRKLEKVGECKAGIYGSDNLYGAFWHFGLHIRTNVVIERLKGKLAGILYSGPYG